MLRYADNFLEVENIGEWKREEEVYVSFTKDDAGFSKIKSVSRLQPSDDQDYLKTKVRNVPSKNYKRLTIDYPFDRYYMEESKAYDAEKIHRETRRDSSKTAYALVNIKNGQAVLRDVLIDDVPIRELVKENQAKQE